MTERSAQQTSQRTPTHPPPADPPASEAPTQVPGSEAAGSSEASDSGTAVRPGLAERIQAKLAAAGSDDEKAEERPATVPGTSVTDDASAAKPRAPRRARLRLTRVDPWSVMKTSFLLSIAFGVVTVVAVAMVWQVLGAVGVWDSINSTIQETVGGQDTAGLDVENYVGMSRVLGFTMVVAAIDVVLLTAIATLGAFLYNMAAALLGGIEVTLAEE